MQHIAINFISYFFTMTIYWRSTRSICYYSIFHFCWYNMYDKYNLITRNHWSINNAFKILAILTSTCARIPTVILFACTIIFSFTLTCFIIPFLFWIANCTVAFAFTITWDMLCHYFSFIFICYHIKYFNIF